KTVSPATWGLECPKCGLRLARHRVKNGLYHRTCGPKAGHLIRALKDSADRVDAWVSQAAIETEILQATKGLNTKPNTTNIH
ncbi:uncharacterized protein METZ01_LOCUS262488, partial [marine metagenome]